jgi:hypothetical protein
MFAIRLVPDHDLVIDTVGVRAPLGSSFVVLHDKALFPFGNVVPVSFATKESVTTKHQLQAAGVV